MAHTLLQSTKLPSSVGLVNNRQFRGSNKASRTATMLCTTHLVPMRMNSFSGLRGTNSLDAMVHPAYHTLQAKVASRAPTARRGRKSMTPRAMFERFTEKAIKVIMLAQEEARRLGHNFVGTEQILLGLIGEGTGIAAKVLKSMGINLKDARIEVEKIIGRGSGFVAVEIPFTPRAKRVLELSLEDARQLGHNYIGSEHLLLGLLREGEGVAARVLENLGADPSNIRTQIIRMVGESAEAVGAGVGGGSSGSKMPTLEKYGTNLTKLAEETKKLVTSSLPYMVLGSLYAYLLYLSWTPDTMRAMFASKYWLPEVEISKLKDEVNQLQNQINEMKVDESGIG